MSVFYDGNGNSITIDVGSGASAFGVTDYKLYTDNDGSARQAVLTYDGKRLYPVQFSVDYEIRRDVCGCDNIFQNFKFSSTFTTSIFCSKILINSLP